jgi:homoserine kinase type II
MFAWAQDKERLGSLAATWGIAFVPVREPAEVPGGLRYSLESAHGRVWLRVLERVDAARLEKEARFLAHLQAMHFPAPEPVPATSGKGHVDDRELSASLFHAPSGEPRPPADLTFDALERLGDELGKLHRVGNHFPEALPPIDLEAPGNLLRRLTNSPERQIANAAASLLARLAVPEVGLLPEGPVHGAISPATIRWLANRVSAVHGFERLGFAPFALDVAHAVSAFCLEPGLDPALARAVVLGYERQRKLTQVEVAGLPAFIAYAAIARAADRLARASWEEALGIASTALEVVERVERSSV